VAQLDSASVFGTEGYRFESYRVYFFLSRLARPRESVAFSEKRPNSLFPIDLQPMLGCKYGWLLRRGSRLRRTNARPRPGIDQIFPKCGKANILGVMQNSTPIHLFFGEMTANQARVYARASRAADDQQQLRGRIHGPYCERSKTLSSDFDFVDLGPGDDLLSEALVTDPCPWSPDLPALYQAELQLGDGEQAVATIDQMLGFRAVGAKGSHLYVDGRRFVLRGADVSHVPATLIDQWYYETAVMVVDDPSDEVCAEASRRGVWVLAKLLSDVVSLQSELQRLSRHAAVFAIVADGKLPITDAIIRAVPNALFFQQWQPTERVESWATALLVAQEDVAAAVASFEGPVIARGDALDYESLEAARRACDSLQRDLAPVADLAGYLV
jgi:hypothetical protein